MSMVDPNIDYLATLVDSKYTLAILAAKPCGKLRTARLPIRAKNKRGMNAGTGATSMLNGKKIVLGVSGGIAIYKAVDLVSKLRKRGAEIRVVMTEHATKFVSPLLFSEISGNPAAVSMWDNRGEHSVEHIALANWADLLVVAPATANILAKAACGLADDLLSTVLLATACPKIVCPAMNSGMYANPATQENLDTLRHRGYTVMEPDAGHLACGVNGPGRLPEVPEIIAFLERFTALREIADGKITYTRKK